MLNSFPNISSCRRRKTNSSLLKKKATPSRVSWRIRGKRTDCLSLSLSLSLSLARKIPDEASSKFFLPSDISFRNKETLEKRGEQKTARGEEGDESKRHSTASDCLFIFRRGERTWTILHNRDPGESIDSPGTAAVARKWWKHVELSRDLRGTLLITRATGSEGDSAFIKQKVCVDLMGEPSLFRSPCFPDFIFLLHNPPCLSSFPFSSSSFPLSLFVCLFFFPFSPNEKIKPESFEIIFYQQSSER